MFNKTSSEAYPYSHGYEVQQEVLKGKYHCTIDLLFDRLGLVCFANKNKNCQLSYSWFQTSQTGGQQYSDTSPFSIPRVQLQPTQEEVHFQIWN